jgi:hypothetical protein
VGHGQGPAAEGGQGGYRGLGQPAGVGDPEQHAQAGLGPKTDRIAAAAISENGISNLLAEWGVEDDGGDWLAAELGGPPWERPEVYVASSPIAAADRIRTPLLLIHADLDRNCPIGQSEQMLARSRNGVLATTGPAGSPHGGAGLVPVGRRRDPHQHDARDPEGRRHRA